MVEKVEKRYIFCTIYPGVLSYGFLEAEEFLEVRDGHYARDVEEFLEEGFEGCSSVDEVFFAKVVPKWVVVLGWQARQVRL